MAATDTHDTGPPERSQRTLYWGPALGGAGAVVAPLIVQSLYATWLFIFIMGTAAALIGFTSRWRQPWFWWAAACLVAINAGLILANISRPLPMPKYALMALTLFDGLLNALFLYGVERLWWARNYAAWRSLKPFVKAAASLAVAITGFTLWWIEGI